MNKFFLLALFFSINILSQTDKPTTIYLVRHAEKVTTDPTDKDPLLTKKGQQRALSLVKKLKKVKLDAIYTSKYQRNKLTAKPIAEKQQLTLKLYDSKNLTELAQTILKENKGQNVLVVGHSNTILETIEALGGKRPFYQIFDYEYHFLFILTIYPDAHVTIEVTHFGKPSEEPTNN